MALYPITLLTATAASSSKINLSWHNNHVYDSIVVSRKPAGGAYSVIKTLGYVGSWSDMTCEDGTQYYYKVRAYISGIDQGFSNEADATTTLDAASNMDGEAVSISECDTTWTINSTNHTGVKLYMDGSLLVTLGKVTHYEKTGLAEGSTHTWKVKVFNTLVESGFSNTVSITQEERPAAPSLCVATPLSTSSIRITWQDNSDDETGFRVYGSDAGIAYTELANSPVGRNVTTITQTGLASNKLRYYIVKSYSGAGTSAASNVATATTFAAISTPTGLIVIPVSGTVVDVYFNDNSSEEDDHRLERAAGIVPPEAVPDGGFEVWDSATDLTYWTEYLQGTSTVNREASSVHAGAYCVRFDIDASNHYAVISSFDVTMTPGGDCVFSVWYHMSNGVATSAIRIRDIGANVYLKSDGTWSASAQAIVLPNATVDTLYTFAFTAHASYSAYYAFVGHNTAYGSSAASASLYFDDFSVCGAGFSEVATLAPNQEAYRMTGLAAGTAYSVRIRAKQGTAYSNYSTIVNFTTLAVPATPADLAISETQDTFIRLTWTGISGVTGYKIKKSVAGGAYAALIDIWGDDITSYKATGLTPGVLYGFEVAAYNGAGTSAYSAPVTSTTLTTYAPSAIEKLFRKPTSPLIYLLEISPLLPLSGFTLSDGQTYTYELTLGDEERGIEITSLTASGVTYSAKTSIATVEATASTYWHDYYGGKIYIHTAGGDSPSEYLVLGAFWLYFTNV